VEADVKRRTGFGRRGVVLAGAAAALLLSVACESTLKTSADWDKTADFTKYRTFSWKRTGELKDPIWERRIEGVIEDELAKKGLTPSPDGDLLAVTHPRLSRETRVESYNAGWGYGWGYGWGPAMTTTTVREIPVGTLVIDLVDARKKEIVWRGVASDTLNTDPSRTNEEREQALRRVVAQLFAGFPPPKK
jgi:hypothetical protein